MGLEVLYLLIPATFVLAAVSLALFVWAIHAGQFDDLDTPAIRILFDEDEAQDVSPEPPESAAERVPPTREPEKG